MSEVTRLLYDTVCDALIELGRGARQGDPIASILFVLRMLVAWRFPISSIFGTP